jgi:hypothetical protein
MPTSGFGQFARDLNETAINVLGRPSWAIGNLLQGDPQKALEVLTALRKIQPEERVTPSQALGVTHPLASTIVDIATDPVMWIGGRSLAKGKPAKPMESRIQVESELARLLKEGADIKGTGPIEHTQRRTIMGRLRGVGPTTLRKEVAPDVSFKTKGGMSKEGAQHVLDQWEVRMKSIPTSRELQFMRVEEMHDITRRILDTEVKAGTAAKLPRLGDTAESAQIKNILADMGLHDLDVQRQAEKIPAQNAARVIGVLKRHARFTPQRPDDLGVFTSKFSPGTALRGTGLEGIALQGYRTAEDMTYAMLLEFRKNILPGLKVGSPEVQRIHDALHLAEEGGGIHLLPPELQPHANRLAEYYDKLLDNLDAQAVKRGLEPLRERSRYGKGTYIYHQIERLHDKGGGHFDPVSVETVPKYFNYFGPEQRRLGAPPIRDAIVATESYIRLYVKHMILDPMFERLAKAKSAVPPHMGHYIDTWINAMKGAPTWQEVAIAKTWDSIAKRFRKDKTIETTPYQVRKSIGHITGWIFRGGLAMSLSSSVNNLTQQLNAAAEFGKHWTGAVKRMALGLEKLTPSEKQMLFREFPDMGMLHESTAGKGAVSKAWQKANEFMMKPFGLSEKLNRTATYFAARDYAIQELRAPRIAAEKFALDAVDRLQFGYTAVSRPPYMSQPLARIGLQFISYPLRQTELMYRWVTDKHWTTLARYLSLSAYVMYAARNTFGIELSNTLGTGVLPNADITRLPLGPLPNLAWAALNADWDTFKRQAAILLPAGVQGRRVVEFVNTVRNGMNKLDKQGRVQYQETTKEAIYRLLGFWPSSLEEQRAYIQRLTTLRDQYQAVRQEAISATIDGAPEEAQGIIEDFTRSTGVPIQISERDLKRYSEWANMPAWQRAERILPKKARETIAAGRPQ